MHLLFAALLAWNSWHASAVTRDHGYPVFTVDGKPFFVYGAAFFYERIPRDRWRDALLAYKSLGINTIDLYLIWNWHEPQPTVRDFTGATDPRRDLAGLLKITHELGYKLILRPGPVIRNEWRNGGYPDWLLERPEYDMPLHDVLEGRYPATATFQNAHADAAAAEWLHNSTHLQYAAQWLHDALAVTAPYSGDVIAIALDDDQGAYLDNDTWPAPHWHAYIDWLRKTVAASVGSHVPLFLNTFEMKVPAASPAWAWGNWYQSDAYAIGTHDLAELDFATGLLQTQDRPVMQSEFQAGWLQGADEGLPRPANPTNTALALNELLRDGAHGIVNFPVQDTIYPDGWEAPWANWSYAWDAALTTQLQASLRYAPTQDFGLDVGRYGSLLARTHPAVDVGVAWPPSFFTPGTVSNARFAAFKDATIAMQRECNARHLTCSLVDFGYETPAAMQRIPHFIVPIEHALVPPYVAKRLIENLGSIRPRLSGTSDATLLLADDGSYGFVDLINPSDTARTIGPVHVALAGRSVTLPAFQLSGRSARLLPVGLSVQQYPSVLVAGAGPPPFADPDATVLENSNLKVAFAPNAGARVAELSASGIANAASSIGLLRDAVDPEPAASSRDYIAPYTHPLPAGTFNRPYKCVTPERDHPPRFSCSYDARDIAGGTHFERTMSIDPNDNELVITLRFQPQDHRKEVRLESISGFAFDDTDTLVAPAGAPGVGILHGNRLVSLRWDPGAVVHVDVRRTRGAQLVTLVFARNEARLHLGIVADMDASKAEGFLRANRP
jgi:hypothetical protein